jgi:hypothetical protein
MSGSQQALLRDVAGVPECDLSDAIVALLPAGSPPAPWETTAQAVLWAHPATPAARGMLPAPLRGRRTLPLTVGAFVRYLDSPVGPYSEVLASPALLAQLPLPASVVPFIAVDSTDSLHAGRANWALPKTLARFDWSLGEDAFDGRPFRVRATHDETPVPWSVAARVATRPGTLQVSLPLRDVQPTPEGGLLSIAITVSGEARLARVEVDADGPSLPAWLRSGSHPGLLLPHARMTFAAPN